MNSNSNKGRGTTCIDLVVARYEEDVRWICNEEFSNFQNIFVYNKGASSIFSTSATIDNKFKEFFLPNVGREAHTFLHHIVLNYDNLADVVVFIPGSGLDSIKQHKTRDVIHRTIESQDSIISGLWYYDIRKQLYRFQIDCWAGTSSVNQAALPTIVCEPSSIRPFGKWYYHYFRDLVTNVVCYTSTFSISRDSIYRREKVFYEELLAHLSSHSNPEVGHYLERAWAAVFYPLEVYYSLYICYYSNLTGYFSTFSLTGKMLYFPSIASSSRK